MRPFDSALGQVCRWRSAVGGGEEAVKVILGECCYRREIFKIEWFGKVSICMISGSAQLDECMVRRSRCHGHRIDRPRSRAVDRTGPQREHSVGFCEWRPYLHGAGVGHPRPGCGKASTCPIWHPDTRWSSRRRSRRRLRLRHELERDTKTRRSRVVEVPASALAELRTHVRLRVGSDPNTLVFTTPFDDPVRLSNWPHRV